MHDAALCADHGDDVHRLDHHDDIRCCDPTYFHVLHHPSAHNLSYKHVPLNNHHVHRNHNYPSHFANHELNFSHNHQYVYHYDHVHSHDHSDHHIYDYDHVHGRFHLNVRNHVHCSIVENVPTTNHLQKIFFKVIINQYRNHLI